MLSAFGKELFDEGIPIKVSFYSHTATVGPYYMGAAENKTFLKILTKYSKKLSIFSDLLEVETSKYKGITVQFKGQPSVGKTGYAVCNDLKNFGLDFDGEWADELSESLTNLKTVRMDIKVSRGPFKALLDEVQKVVETLSSEANRGFNELLSNTDIDRL